MAAAAQIYRLGGGGGGGRFYYVIVAATAQRYREGEEVYWHDIVAAIAICCKPFEDIFYYNFLLGQVKDGNVLLARYGEINQILGTRAASCSYVVEVDPQQLMFRLLRSVRASGRPE